MNEHTLGGLGTLSLRKVLVSVMRHLLGLLLRFWWIPLWIYVLTGELPEAFASTRPDLEVQSIVVSKNCVETSKPELYLQAVENPECPRGGDNQLIQITVSNRTAETQQVGVQLEIREGGIKARPRVQRTQRTIQPYSETRVLYTFRIPQTALGRYNVSASVYNENFSKRLLRSDVGVNRDFYVLNKSAIEEAKRVEEEKVAAEKERQQPEKLEFEPADLKWAGIQVLPKHILRGEKFRIRLDLVNVGGDIARDVQNQVDYFNVRLPTRRTTIATPSVESLLPGETVTFELEYTLPDDQLLGEYQVLATTDPQKRILESKEQNNSEASPNLLLSDIKLLLPPDDFAFNPKDLFLFQWNSLLFREFKVQIGVDEEFNDPNRYFDLPQAERWIADKELVPLAGEMPTLGQGLMRAHNVQKLFWRVIGRKTDGKQTVSSVRSFTIKPSQES